jgi:4-alpha-glucanotransferase
MASRRAGLVAPLFSCASSASWGIGELPDLVPLSAWLASAGIGVLQILPINEMAPDEQSPYAALSAMAIDPIFIRLTDVPEFHAAGGTAAFAVDDHAALLLARSSHTVAFHAIRQAKRAALRASFDQFVADEPAASTRSAAFAAFVGRNAWWLHEYAMFRAIHARFGERPWTEWPDDFRHRDPYALERAREELGLEIRYVQFLQWIADDQWREARQHTAGVRVFGDLPFMVNTDSADVWARQDQFHLDATIGAPPDAFSAEGQDWLTAAYRWDVHAHDDFRWMRERARRASDLFDGFRIDHLVGLYRTYTRPMDGSPAYFSPADERDQLAQGERLVQIFRDAGAEVIAEDLGTVPDFVRESIARLNVPGFKVFRWERQWHEDRQPFRDPAEYPVRSVAVSGTHDTEPIVTWWTQASEDERHLVAAVPTIQRISGDVDLVQASIETVRDVLLEALFASQSELLIMPIQDVFGWSDRINDPAVMNEHNWVYKLPWLVDAFDHEPRASERQRTLRHWAERHQRL